MASRAKEPVRRRQGQTIKGKQLARMKARFLAVLSEGWSVTRAAKAAGVDRALPYLWKERDPEFKKAWAIASEKGADRLEDEAVRRAAEGVLRPVYQQGRRVGVVREYSDKLMEIMLRANRPQRFSNKTEVTGAGGGALVPPALIINFEDPK